MRDQAAFDGEFASWDLAARRAGSYADARIVERVRRSTLAVLRGEGAFERDGVVFPRGELRATVVAAVALAAVARGGGVDVVDFGGGLGGTFLQCRDAIGHLVRSWRVVDQPAFVDVGRRDVDVAPLVFYRDIDEAIGGGIDLLVLSSVLQYLPDPHAFLERCQQFASRFLLVDRQPLWRGGRDIAVVQTVPSSIYGFVASKPAWILDEAVLLRTLTRRYRLVGTLGCDDPPFLLARGRGEYRAFLLATP